ncbi:MAG: AAA family ATPase [Paludibacteraceae bacterium]|nr:AAA family ATPase [Paludibacteraceae bacterium]
MGIYLNPDNSGFKMALAADIYVDKTMMISQLNHFIDKGNSYICVSRPRRFGKTFASNMLCAYYSKGCDSAGLFKNLKIAQADNYSQYLNKLNFIKIDVASEYQNASEKENLLVELTEFIRDEFKAQFPAIQFGEKDTIGKCILRVYAATKETFVIILDEYDCLVRQQFGSELFNNYLEFLNGLFKSDTLRPAISLAYITGILPVVRDRVQSKLNNFEEYTTIDAYELSEYVGFTEEEVKPLCEKYGVDFSECKREYDGYEQNGFEIYNPESVVKCMLKKKIANYWAKTSTYQVITDRLKHNYKGIREDIVRLLADERVKVNVTRYMNTMTDFITKDDVFTYLIHLGYLAYNEQDSTCRIPNREVRREWFNAVESLEDYSVTDEIIKDSEVLLEQTLDMNADAVAKALDRSHIHVTSNRSYNNEDALASAIYLAYIHALDYYYVNKEVTAGKGFADLVLTPHKPDGRHVPIIIELKRNSTPRTALEQIKDKEYFQHFGHYKGKVLLVGINYDEEAKTHDCEIQVWEQ